MQIIFLSPWMTFLACFLAWLIIEITVMIICINIEDLWFKPQSFFFKSHPWEKQGRIYREIFMINKWKDYLPDGGSIIKGGFKRDNLDFFSKTDLQKFQIETCRAEFSHWLAFLPFWVFGFFAPPIVILYMLIYAVVMNVPCIIVQRYNRPRFEKLISKADRFE